MTDLPLAEFLLARIAEDEAVAHVNTGRWYICDDGHVETPHETWADGGDRLPNHHNLWHLIHDPARVLAECDAKRRIVTVANGEDAENWEWQYLSALALPYADHPDYDESWRP